MSFVSVAISILYTPFLLLILCVIFLASIGKSLGVRKLYVNILLKLFEVSAVCHFRTQIKTFHANPSFVQQSNKNVFYSIQNIYFDYETYEVGLINVYQNKKKCMKVIFRYPHAGEVLSSASLWPTVTSSFINR